MRSAGPHAPGDRANPAVASPAGPAWGAAAGACGGPLCVRRLDGGTLRVARTAGDRLALRPLLMGVLNVTPDSFSDGGRYDTADAARARIDALIAGGADVIDIGAESTRPGATPLSADAEWARLAPVVTALAGRSLPVALSIDTRHADVARRAADHEIALLNLPFPEQILEEAGDVAACQAILRRFEGVIVMHARGNPATMRQHTDYGDNLCQTVVDELRQTATALTGDDPVLCDRLLYDPGLGFAKTAEQSIELLARTAWLSLALPGPLVVGASRKSMLGAVTGLPVDQRLIPSVVAAALAAQAGAAMVRVHDVAETRAALALLMAVRGAAATPMSRRGVADATGGDGTVQPGDAAGAGGA